MYTAILLGSLIPAAKGALLLITSKLDLITLLPRLLQFQRKGR
jgi:hypothetical protein